MAEIYLRDVSEVPHASPTPHVLYGVVCPAVSRVHVSEVLDAQFSLECSYSVYFVRMYSVHRQVLSMIRSPAYTDYGSEFPNVV